MRIILLFTKKKLQKLCLCSTTEDAYCLEHRYLWVAVKSDAIPSHCFCMCFSQSLQSWVPLRAETVARQALQSMGFSRQEYWSGLPCPPPEDPTPEIKPLSPMSPALHCTALHCRWILTHGATWEAHYFCRTFLSKNSFHLLSIYHGQGNVLKSLTSDFHAFNIYMTSL